MVTEQPRVEIQEVGQASFVDGAAEIDAMNTYIGMGGMATKEALKSEEASGPTRSYRIEEFDEVGLPRVSVAFNPEDETTVRSFAFEGVRTHSETTWASRPGVTLSTHYDRYGMFPIQSTEVDGKKTTVTTFRNGARSSMEISEPYADKLTTIDFYEGGVTKSKETIALASLKLKSETLYSKDGKPTIHRSIDEAVGVTTETEYADSDGKTIEAVRVYDTQGNILVVKYGPVDKPKAIVSTHEGANVVVTEYPQPKNTAATIEPLRGKGSYTTRV